MIYSKSCKVLHELTHPLIYTMAEKFGKAYVDIVLHWPDIVGESISKQAQVYRLSYDKYSQNGTLTLSCTSAIKPLLHMQSPLIIERINRYFGYKAIESLRFMSKTVTAPSQPLPIRPKKTLSEQETQTITAQTHTIANPELRDALQKLGLSIYQQER